MEELFLGIRRLFEQSKKIFRFKQEKVENPKEKPRIVLQTADALVVQLTNSREMDMLQSPEIMQALQETGCKASKLVQLLLGHLNSTEVSRAEHDEPVGSDGQPHQLEHVVERVFLNGTTQIAVRDDKLFPAVSGDVDLSRFNVSEGTEIIFGDFGAEARLAIVTNAHEEGEELVASNYAEINIGPNTLAILKPRAANKWTLIPDEPRWPFRMIYMQLPHPTQPAEPYRQVVMKS